MSLQQKAVNYEYNKSFPINNQDVRLCNKIKTISDQTH